MKIALDKTQNAGKEKKPMKGDQHVNPQQAWLPLHSSEWPARTWLHTNVMKTARMTEICIISEAHSAHDWPTGDVICPVYNPLGQSEPSCSLS